MISIQNLSLGYTIYNDKTSSLKEFVINKFHRRSYVEKAKEEFWALKNINLEVKSGERLAIIGRNGAGKSTLLKVISKILKPTKGQKADYATRMKRQGVSFADAWSASFVQDKYGAATTHWRKLEDRVHRGVGNPCPLLLIGLPSTLVTFGEPLEADDLGSEEAD